VVPGSGFRVAGSWVLGVAALIAVAAAEPRIPNPQPGTPNPQPDTPNPVPATRFRFQNNFWVNLHHVLRGEARRRDVRAAPRLKVSALSDAEEPVWSAALDAYKAYGQRNPTFDDRLIAINNALATIAGETSLAARPGEIDAATARALTAAAPIYRAHFWIEQKQLNDRWIGMLQATLAAHGSAMAAALARTYRVQWPSSPILVDACAEAGANGGYTTSGPPGTAAHTVIEAANPGYQDEMAFEMIFHEASHAAAISDPMIDAINGEASRQHVTAPPDLWHVIIFYTAGELARRELGKVGDVHYMPYAYRYGVYTRGWQALRDGVVDEWQPYLDGRTTFDTALAALVRATRQP
jgi:hypothetical protein